MSSTDETIRMFKEEDAKLDSVLQYVVPVSHGSGGVHGPAYYPHKKEPAIWEKQDYAKLLIPNAQIQPRLEITDEDIQVMKDKAYRATEWDFNNYVGEMLKPNESPANKAFLHKIYPEWFTKQTQAIENWHDTKKRIEKLQIMGPKSKEDLFMLYRLGFTQNGGIGSANEHTQGQFRPLIKQVNDPAPTVGQNMQSAREIRANFQRGIFNTDRKTLTAKSMQYGNRSAFVPRDLSPAQVASGDTGSDLWNRMLPSGGGYGGLNKDAEDRWWWQKTGMAIPENAFGPK